MPTIKAITDMDGDEIENLITVLRARRERAETVFKLHRHSGGKIKVSEVADRINKQCDLAQKNYDAAVKALTKLEERLNDITALRLIKGDLDAKDAISMELKNER